MLIHRLVESEKNNKVSEGKDGSIRKQIRAQDHSNYYEEKKRPRGWCALTAARERLLLSVVAGMGGAAALFIGPRLVVAVLFPRLPEGRFLRDASDVDRCRQMPRCYWLVLTRQGSCFSFLK
jgi:hypothetical protein